MPETLLPNIIQFIDKIDPFDKLPTHIVRELASSIKITYLHKDECIEQHAGNAEKYLYIVRTGSMEQRKLNGVLRAKLGPEDLFGFSFSQHSDNDQHKGYIAKALDNTLLYLLPHSRLLALFEHQPEYAPHFAFEAQVRLQSALDVVWSNKEKGLFVKSISEVDCDRAVIVQASDPIQDVARALCEKPCAPCAVVYKDEQLVGMITDRDITQRVVMTGIDITRSIEEVMTSNPVTVLADDLVMKAVSLMMQHNVRHIPVISGHARGYLLSASNLVQNHRVQAIFLIEKIANAQDMTDLTRLITERQAIFEALVEGHVNAEIIGKVMTMIMDGFTKRVIEFALAQLGAAPCDFAWVVAGSGARNEIHMLSDQNNALILSDNMKAEDRHYFHQFALFVNQHLAECGYLQCQSGYMPATSKWCQSLDVWLQYYSKWIEKPNYTHLLKLTVFLETRVVYGNRQLADNFQSHLQRKILSNSRFLDALVAISTVRQPPLSIFNQHVLERDGSEVEYLDIKMHVLNLIIDLARIYGLKSQSDAQETKARFVAANQAGHLSDDLLQDILGAYQFICQYRFNHQLDSLKKGVEPNNLIAPSSLGSFERKHLKDAFRIIENLQDVAKMKFS